MEDVAEIRVELNRNQLLTQGEIDDHPVRVLIDTGSNVSMIWRPAIERLGLRMFTGPRMRIYGLGGESPVYAAFVKDFRAAKFTVTNRRFPVAGDLPSGMDFILAEDLLSRSAVEFDLGHGVVRTMTPTGCATPELPYWAKTYSLVDLLASPHDALAIQVNVMLNGHRVRALLDSGSSISIVSKSIADSLGVQYADTAGELVGIGHRSLKMWLANIESFALGDETIRDTQLRVAQMDRYRTTTRVGSRIPVAVGNGAADMLLGLDFLRVHRVLIDNTTRKMVFTYEGGPVFEITGPVGH